MQEIQSFYIMNLDSCRLQIADFKTVESLAETIGRPIVYLKSNLSPEWTRHLDTT